MTFQVSDNIRFSVPLSITIFKSENFRGPFLQNNKSQIWGVKCEKPNYRNGNEVVVKLIEEL